VILAAVDSFSVSHDPIGAVIPLRVVPFEEDPLQYKPTVGWATGLVEAAEPAVPAGETENISLRGNQALLQPPVHCRRTITLYCAVISFHLGIGHGSARWPASTHYKKGAQQSRMHRAFGRCRPKGDAL